MHIVEFFSDKKAVEIDKRNGEQLYLLLKPVELITGCELRENIETINSRVLKSDLKSQVGYKFDEDVNISYTIFVEYKKIDTTILDSFLYDIREYDDAIYIYDFIMKNHKHIKAAR